MRRWKPHIVAALVGLYPARWKREYGEELRDVLLRRRLDAATAADAIWNAVRQQLRLGEPWVLTGIPLLALNLTGIVRNILYAGAYQYDTFDGNRPHLIPSLGLLLPLAIGYWTVARDPISEHRRAGRAAMKNILLVYWPFFVIGALYGLGVLRVIVLGPGDPATSFHEHGFAYTVYDHTRQHVAWTYLFALPLIQLPLCGGLGVLGGLAARGQAHFRRRRA
jgi:hypothetical protein